MKASEYKEKAEILLEKFCEYKTNNSFDNEEYSGIKDEFLHLVYFFDANLPMLEEMKQGTAHPGLTKYDRDPEKYMRRFLHYLNEYCINK